MRTVAIIPARGGSTRIPGKNSKLFAGVPIIGHSIEAALLSGLFDDIYVSTDCDKIARIAENYNVHVLRRPAALAQDQIGTQEVMRDALGLVVADMACCIYATTPLMYCADLKRGQEALFNNKDALFAFSVGTEPLQDAAQFYWGWPEAFGVVPLFGEFSIMIPIDSARVCDINTADDWDRALIMWELLKQKGEL